MGIYHIGSGEEISIREVALAVGRYFKKTLKVVPSGQTAKGGTKRRCPDIRKLKTLGFKPKFSFEKGLKQTLKWYDENFNLVPQSKLKEERNGE